MTVDRERRLRTAQRRMLRLVYQSHRRKGMDFLDEESYINWLKRTTVAAESAMDALGYELWVPAQRRKKWRWAGHVARMADHRWTCELLWWQPASGNRNVGRPRIRWSDPMEQFFSTIQGSASQDWMLVAQDRPTWQSLEDAFCQRT